jgi:hypothetical protein
LRLITVTEFLERDIRFRNYAEELKIIAAERSSVENSQALLRVADDYERMAKSLEAMRTAKKAMGLPASDFKL